MDSHNDVERQLVKMAKASNQPRIGRQDLIKKLTTRKRGNDLILFSIFGFLAVILTVLAPLMKKRQETKFANMKGQHHE